MYNNELQTLIYFGNSSLHEEDIFKRELINFAQSIVDSVPIVFNADFDYDGVIINNVLDYGSRVENQDSHTVYECMAIVLNYDKPVYKDIIQIKHLDDSITSEKTKK